jgi:tetratricopeptide (TPR) repeat protein
MLALELVNDPAFDPWPVLDDALAAAHRVGSPVLVAQILWARLQVRGDLVQRVGSGDAYDLEPFARDIAAVESAVDDGAEPTGRYWVVGALVALANRRGDLEAAARLADEMTELVDRGGRVVERWTAAFHTAGTRLYTGDHDEAAGLIARAAELGRSAGEPDVDQLWGNQMLFLRRQQGHPEEMIEIAETIVDAQPVGWGEWCAALALLQSEAGRVEDARGSFDRALTSHRDPGHRPWMPTAATLAHVAADLGAVEVADELIDQLRPVSGQTVGWLVLATLGPADLAIGRLHLLAGRTDEAAAALAASAELCERGGLRPFLAQTRLAQGEVAIAAGDEAAARVFLDRALEVAEAGDFRTTVRRARAALATLD